MSHEVIAAPEFAAADLAWLTALRQAHAGSRGGPPHFTLVFPGSTLETAEFTTEVQHAAAGLKRIRFCLRSAMIVLDPEVHSFHVFLVPDEGFGALIRLHDKLHSSRLAPQRRDTPPYVPHITVATERDFAAAHAHADLLNAKNMAICGRLDELIIQRRDGETARLVRKVALTKAGLFG
jgi:2'-5' RNA ligase